MSQRSYVLTANTNMTEYMEPSEPLPQVGDIYRFGRDPDTITRFYLIYEILVPSRTKDRAMVPYELLDELDYKIVCITFCWSEETKSFSLFEGVKFPERWFRKPLDDGVPKFVRVSHASDNSSDPDKSFLLTKWMTQGENNEWICKIPK